ncbi:regulating synaptic membrane exocytosis protein 1 [Galendromus occidentalis]|uniref:Regulating synaptic membrane exocytosis protein 1 n=1 Tax=Galendromus occidentalis TaxID=34638 RepID=A0AAJ7SHG5_9ACAR|nr:regulating synaptic membrane exocytosis protein 1 [Galendromus occidentalis]
MSNCLAGPGGTHPDLSHLTAEERLIIQGVLARQRAEEQKERDLLKRETDQVKQLESNIVTKIGQNARNPLEMLLGSASNQHQQQQQQHHHHQQQQQHQQQLQQHQQAQHMGPSGMGPHIMGPQSGSASQQAPPATCQLCLKTKFADGVGHICNYCNVRCCARCGGKVNLRSNKVIWVCILCRKKQELLIKSGQWINQPLNAMATNPQQQQQQQQQMNPQHSMSVLQRARSVEIPSGGPSYMGPGMAGNAAGMGTSVSGAGGLWRGRMGNSFNEYQDPYQQQQQQQNFNMMLNQNQTNQMGFGGYNAAQNRRGEFRRQLSAGNAEYGACYQQQQFATQPQIAQTQSQQNLTQPNQGAFGMPLLKNPTNLSNSFQNLFSRPFGKGQLQQQQQMQQQQQQLHTQNYQQQQMVAMGSQVGMGSAGIIDPTFPQVLGSHPNITGGGNSSGLGPGNQLGIANARTRGGMLRNDSLSSDQSYTESHHMHQHRRRHSRKLGKKKKRSSTSGMTAGTRSSSGRGRGSSDDELNSDCSSFGSIEDLESDFRREELFEGKFKRFPANPVNWRPSSNNPGILIGHMLLKKLPSGLGSQETPAQILGIKIVGGKILRNSRNKKTLGAIIERVRKGSTADVVGHLKPGDQVLEWNGHSLRQKTYEEVFEIIQASSQDLQVELIVSRPLVEGEEPMGYDPRGSKDTRRHSSATLLQGASSGLKRSDYLRKTSSTTYLPPAGSLGMGSRRRSITSMVSLGQDLLGGRIQIKLWYDAAQLQLVVTVVCAAELPPRLVAAGPSNPSMNLTEPRNPYAKLFLLPDRSDQSKRRTKTIAASDEPYWNQTFIYSPLRRSDLMQRALEVTVWDYDRYGANDFLGETIVDLANINIPFQDDINEEGEWYLLSMESNRYSGEGFLCGSTHIGHSASASVLRPAPRSSSAMLTTRQLMASSSARWYSEGEELSEWEAASLDEYDSPSMYLDSSGRQRVGSLDTLNLQSQGFSRRRPSFGGRAGLMTRGDTSFLHAVHPLDRATGSSGQPDALGGAGGLPPTSNTSMSSTTAAVSGHHIHPHHSLTSSLHGQPPSQIAHHQKHKASVLLRGCSLEEDDYHHQSGTLQPSAGGSNLSLRSLSPPRTFRSNSPTYSLSHETLIGQKRQLPPIPSGRYQRGDQSTLDLEERARQIKARMRRASRVGPSPVYVSDSELGVQSSSSYYSERERERMDQHYGDQMRGRDRHRESSMDRWERRDSRDHSEALHRGASDRRQSGSTTAADQHSRHHRGHGSGGQQASRTLSEFTLQENQSGGPVHPLTSSGRGSSNELSSVSGTMARDSGGRERRELTRRAESVEESTRTSSQSVSETKEGSEEGSLSDTTTANEDKLGGSSFEIADVSSYTSSHYAKANQTSSSSSHHGGHGHHGQSSQQQAGGGSGGAEKQHRGDHQQQASSSQQQQAAQQSKSKGARLGFRNRRKNKIGRGVHRSEEVAPDEVRHLVRQASSVSSDGEGSLSGDSATTWGASSVRGASSVTSVVIPPGGFVEGLGPGQLVGRQALASPSLGDIQMSFCDRKGNLEVEVIRARGLQTPPGGANVLPAPYVKVYLNNGNSIVAKAKTTAARRTLDPLFQQRLIFHEDYRGCLLQVTVWGDYGTSSGVRLKNDGKAFMGMAQINLDDLDLGRIVIGWYKLFHPTSLVNVVASQPD